MDWKLFTSTFVLIFVAELPDKTAFASLLLATRNRPLPVFFGAAGAFVIQSLVAVTFGHWIGLVSAVIIHRIVGLVFLILAILMWTRHAEPNDVRVSDAAGKQFMKTAASAFMVIFIAEWGDLTQLATATLSARYNSPATIFFSATLALWAVTGIGVVIGHQTKRAIQPVTLQRIAAVALAGVGIFFLSQSAI